MERLRIIVTGMVGQIPVGGVAWDYLQYVIGLSNLGHDVCYHEDTWTWPYHPIRQENVDDPVYSSNYLRDFFARYAPQLSDRWHYHHLHEKSCGMSAGAFRDFAATADIFINVSGASMIPENLNEHCVKVFLDTDPGYNQIMLTERFAWSENVDRWCSAVAAHDLHFTYAENIHARDCTLPHAGFKWKTTRMPVVLGLWNDHHKTPAKPVQNAPWTTVMTWNAFKGKVIYKGVEYGSKGMEFEKLLELPRHVSSPLLVAVGGKNVPMDRLKKSGWLVTDGPTVSVNPESYQRFIFESRGEISPAKNVYVATRSGWFSCRTACYLAASRPCVVQNTGFDSYYPLGQGLIAFDTPDEAAEAIATIEADYDNHSAAARDVAYETLESSKVLKRFIRDIDASDT